MKFLDKMYDKLGDYLTFEELVFVDALLIVGGIAGIFYSGKYLIDLVLPW